MIDSTNVSKNYRAFTNDISVRIYDNNVINAPRIVAIARCYANTCADRGAIRHIACSFGTLVFSDRNATVGDYGINELT